MASLFSLPLCSQGLGELRIVVKDPSETPVSAAGKIENLQTGWRRSFSTDRMGIFIARDLPAGRYVVQLSKPGFSTNSEVIIVRASSTMDHLIHLQLGVQAFAVKVVGTTPLAGFNQAREDIPVPVQVANAADIAQSGAIGFADLLNLRLSGVYLNEVQGNPMQPDVNYRGYTASPLLGTPQGLSVYMDGVRLNQPFGDVVSWDLIPRIAVAEVSLIAGSNPLFGLNTLGGALSIQTKDGYTGQGTTLQLTGGSFGRKLAEFQHGGSNRRGLNWFSATSLFFEDGWRESSPSDVRQFFGRAGYERDKTSLNLSVSYANNTLTGNGLQEQRFLRQHYASAYTKPDTTANRSPMGILGVRRILSDSVSISGNGYFRYIRTQTFNGDINEGSLDQPIYQPSAAERNALQQAGYTGFPSSGASAANTPFPFWRCIANILLRDEPAEKCNALLNRTRSDQRSYGATGQLNWYSSPASHRNQLTTGFGYDGSSTSFQQSTELGYLNPERSVTGLNAFADAVTGGTVDGLPYDARVNLSGRTHTASAYFTDTLSIGKKLNLTVSARFNHTLIHNLDHLTTATEPGSLSGSHTFNRLNPSAGGTFEIMKGLNAYASYSEGSRAPTAIELGCADPDQPCKLPNALAGDPPLHQVVTRTVEAGIRSSGEGRFRWNGGWFRADNRNDILFVASEQTGFGYFKNFGRTLRKGLDADLDVRIWRARVGGNYTFLLATFESPETVSGTGNSSNHSAQSGAPGFESTIAIRPGNRIPLIPLHLAKAYADLQTTSKLTINASLFGSSGSYARGNEDNLHQPDGVYYIGSGSTPGYVVVNVGLRYQLLRYLQVSAQVSNLLDRQYYTAAQLGPTGFTDQVTFIARPFPPANGDYPVRHSTFFAPGSPRGAWGGIRIQF